MDDYKEVINKKSIIILILLFIILLESVLLIIQSNKNNNIKKADEDIKNKIEVITEEPNVVSEDAIQTVTISPEIYNRDGDSIKDLIEYDIELLKNNDEELKLKYFGESYTIKNTEFDRIMRYTHIHEVESKKNTENRQIIHICTVDMNKLNEIRNKIVDTAKSRNTAITDESLKVIITDGLDKYAKKREYKQCYEIEVEKYNGRLVITEDLKSAITGRWYTGIETKLKDIHCDYD